MADRRRGSRTWTTLNDTCHLFRDNTKVMILENHDKQATISGTDETTEARKLIVIMVSIKDRNCTKASLTEKLTRSLHWV